jgi:Ca2+-binding RTX toxin-like protein
MTLTISTDGVSVTNSGLVEDAPAVLVAGNAVTLTNATGGMLRSTSMAQPAISLIGVNSHIINRGGIEAAVGHLTSILGNASSERVDNYGTIYGWVRLGDGDDIFNQYFSAAAIGTATVDLGGGSDTYSLLVEPGPIIFGSVSGGSGEDRLNLLANLSIVNAAYFDSFEHLTVGANVTNLQNFSNLLSLTLTPGGFNNFVFSANPALDVVLQENSFSIGPNSSFRNITGGGGRETLTFNSSISGNSSLTGSANLGGGGDTVFISVFDASSSQPAITGMVDGGSGLDHISITSRSSLAIDLTKFLNFETLSIGTQAQPGAVTARIIHADGLLEINTADSVTISLSNSPNAIFWGAVRGITTLESTTIVGEVRSPYYPINLADIDIGDAAQNMTIVNNGAILGAVQLYIGDDVYDGSLGTTGGTIFGYAGNDQLTGGAGSEQIEGGFGNDVLTGSGGADILLGGSGDDVLICDLLDTMIDGGAGIDAIRIIGSNAITGTLASIEAVELVSGAGLTLTGSQFANGLANNSTVSGTGSITVNMSAGINFLSQNFVFSGNGVTVTVNGTSGIDIIKCGTGVHIINAGDGVDQIRGGTSADTINGGAGNDKIIGFTGADIITGGTGNDQFRYLLTSDSGLGAAADWITDFTIGGDRLNFLAIDTDAITLGDQGFAFVGNGAFSGGGAASIRYTNSGVDLLVQADVNGDGIADMEIILQGLNGGTLTAADFIL